MQAVGNVIIFAGTHRNHCNPPNSCQNISFKSTNGNLIVALHESSAVAGVISIYYLEPMNPSSQDISAWTNQQAQSHVTSMAKNK